MREFYRHKITRAEFEKIGEANDCTGNQQGKHMVIYGVRGGGAVILVREATDFAQEFELIPHVCQWKPPHDCGDPQCHAKGIIVCAECGEPKQALNG